MLRMENTSTFLRFMVALEFFWWGFVIWTHPSSPINNGSWFVEFTPRCTTHSLRKYEYQSDIIYAWRNSNSWLWVAL